MKKTGRPASWLLGWASPYQSPEAFAELFSQTHLHVYHYITGLYGGSAEAVDDLAAETFLRAWQARARFDGEPRAALGWLLTIARRLVIDAYRRAKSRVPEVPLDEARLSSAERGAEVQVVQRAELRTLQIQLEHLSMQQRELVVLRYLLSWRVKEIAQHVKKSENWVSVNLKRTLARLRQGWPSEE